MSELLKLTPLKLKLHQLNAQQREPFQHQQLLLELSQTQRPNPLKPELPQLLLSKPEGFKLVHQLQTEDGHILQNCSKIYRLEDPHR